MAIAIACAILLVTIWLGIEFDLTQSGFQFQESLPWIPQLGLTYNLGVDGLSFPLLALSSLLTLIVIFSSRIEIERTRLKYALILLVNAGVAGAFLAQNLLLFILFYELILIPLYLLIAIWGGAKREYAAMKFHLHGSIGNFGFSCIFGDDLAVALYQLRLREHQHPRFIANYSAHSAHRAVSGIWD
jgi:NAD(P)H-quinone oxidoreductase subunit 4